MESEVESRYIVPDRLLFRRMLALRSLGDYSLKPAGLRRVVDEYLDTKGRALTRQGWACRLRRDNDTWSITLKGPRVGDGVVHSRPEIEVTLPEATRDYTRWPQGELRETIDRLCGGVALGRLVTVRQKRHSLNVSLAGRPVAALSLDVVRCRGRSMNHKSYMLECELQQGGTAKDLDVLDVLLTEQFDLLPEPRSKLRRALDVVERGGLPDVGIYEQLREVTPHELLERYGSDRLRAEAVSAAAGQLFVGLQALHGLPSELEALTRTAGLLTALGRGSSPGQSHVVARTLVSRHRFIGVSAEALEMIAAAVFLRRKRLSPERLGEVLPDEWSEDRRRKALLIAALVRMAAIFDAEDAACIERIQVYQDGARVLLCGPERERAARRGAKRSDLWQMVMSAPIAWGVASSDGDLLLAAGSNRRQLGLNPWDSMSTAARKVLGYWYQQMLAHEPGTREGTDPEALHDMRVATRRMRSALGLCRLYLSGPEPARANQRLRRAGNALGEVRDLDVAIERAKTYADRLPPESRVDLEPLLKLWARRRDRARRALLRYFDGREYARLQQTMTALLASLAEDDRPSSVELLSGEVAPRLLYVYDAVVEAYDAVLKGAPVQLLHALRIDCKRLRYGLEFFRELLRPDVQALIPEVVRLQDHLGALHDEYVAIEMINAFAEKRGRSRIRASAEAYRDACAMRMDELEAAFPQVWKDYRALGAKKRLRRQIGKRGRS